MKSSLQRKLYGYRPAEAHDDFCSYMTYHTEKLQQKNNKVVVGGSQVDLTKIPKIADKNDLEVVLDSPPPLSLQRKAQMPLNVTAPAENNSNFSTITLLQKVRPTPSMRQSLSKDGLRKK